MPWKNLYNNILLVFAAAVVAFLLAGWSTIVDWFIRLNLAFLVQSWLLIPALLILLFFILRALSATSKHDEIPLIVGVVGAFFFIVGSFAGPLVVLVGLITLLFAVHQNNQVQIQKPELPHPWR